MAKYLDSTGLTHLWAKIKNYVATYITGLKLGDTYVAKEDGKGLSTNDYTTEEKTKLAGIAAGAEVNVQSDWNATSGDAMIKNKPTIPAAVTESTVSGWGFTKNTGTYSKPSTGIPKDDLASAVQSSLEKADTALQSFTESDPTVPAWAKAASKPSYTASEVGAVATSAVGAASGVCPLDANQKVPSANLPSYVDDVIESYARSGQTALSQNWLATGSATGTVITPEAGKIYVLMADSGDYAANSQFRWGGTAYVKLNDGGVSAITNAEIDSITSN